MAPKATSRNSKKGKSQDMNWEDWADQFCVAEPGWEDEPKKVWDCTTCKKYVKMSHLAKLWPRERAAVQVRRWEGTMSTCTSQHFVLRYEEITAAANLPVSKPNVMNYSNMAMIWAEIVLHKEVDWRTIYGRNVDTLNRRDTMIYTNWTGPSDCLPIWSNRGQFGFPAEVLPDAEDDDDDEVDDAPAPVTFGERHERREERQDIEYDQQMREAMRRSLEDYGRPHGYDGNHERNRRARSPQGGRGSTQHGDVPRSGSMKEGRSHGSTQYTASSFGGSHDYPRTTEYGGSNQGGSQYNPGTMQYTGPSEGGSQYLPGSYGHHGISNYGRSSGGGSGNTSAIPPPTFGSFGGPYLGNYREEGPLSGYGYNDRTTSYGLSTSTYPSQEDDSSSNSE